MPTSKPNTRSSSRKDTNSKSHSSETVAAKNTPPKKNNKGTTPTANSSKPAGKKNKSNSPSAICTPPKRKKLNPLAIHAKTQASTKTKGSEQADPSSTKDGNGTANNTKKAKRSPAKANTKKPSSSTPKVDATLDVYDLTKGSEPAASSTTKRVNDTRTKTKKAKRSPAKAKTKKPTSSSPKLDATLDVYDFASMVPNANSEEHNPVAMTASASKLAEFGLAPSPTKGTETGAKQEKGSGKNSLLKCAFLMESDGTFIIFFRLEPVDAQLPGGNFCEKVMRDAYYKDEPWLEELNRANQLYDWHHNGELQLGPPSPRDGKRYPYRLFGFHVQKVTSKVQLLKMAEYICQQINSSNRKPFQTVSVAGPDNFFWLGFKPAVWSELINPGEAFKMLMDVAGHPMPGWHEQNIGVISTFFRKGTYTTNLARTLYAPMEYVSTGKQGKTEKNDNDDDDMDHDDEDDEDDEDNEDDDEGEDDDEDDDVEADEDPKDDEGSFKPDQDDDDSSDEDDDSCVLLVEDASDDCEDNQGG